MPGLAGLFLKKLAINYGKGIGALHTRTHAPNVEKNPANLASLS
jgi:hypothetical protein